MTTLLLVTALTLLISAMCSLFEAVLYSARVGTLEAERTKGGRIANRAVRFIDMKKNVAAPIAAILILNTIANTAGATLAGMFAADLFGPGRVVMYSAGLTLGILVLSEILPKTFGAVHWRTLWSPVLWPLIAMQTVLAPFIWASQKLSYFITKGAASTTVSEEEILAVVSLGAREGHISETESDMVKNIIELENKTARDIMTPRTVMFTLPEGMNAGTAAPQVTETGFSRIPIYKEHPENITGYVLTKDLIRARYEETEQLLSGLVMPLTFVPETANCLTLLNQFLRQRTHIAMVTDEYGGLAGMVTLEDLLETLLGSEIVDETDRTIDMQKMALSRKRPTSEAPAAEPPGEDEPKSTDD